MPFCSIYEVAGTQGCRIGQYFWLNSLTISSILVFHNYLRFYIFKAIWENKFAFLTNSVYWKNIDQFHNPEYMVTICNTWSVYGQYSVHIQYTRTLFKYIDQFCLPWPIYVFCYPMNLTNYTLDTTHTNQGCEIGQYFWQNSLTISSILTSISQLFTFLTYFR